MGGMTPKELSEKSGIVYSTLLPLIKGERDFGISKLLRIAEALNVSIEKILEGTYTIRSNDFVTPKIRVEYLVAFITNSRSTHCSIYNIKTKEEKSAFFPFPIFCVDNAIKTIDTFKESIKQLLQDKNPDFATIAVYASAISTEHVEGRRLLLNEGSKNFNTFILEADWLLAYKALFPNANGILITINDGYAISYSTDNDEHVKKCQGYGYPISDEAGAAWLAMHAVRHAINASEGYEPRTPLSDAILATCNSDLNQLATTLFQRSRDTFVEFTGIVISLAHNKQSKSYALLKESFDNIWRHITTLEKNINNVVLPIKLAGEMAHIYEDFIPKERFAGSEFQHEDKAFKYAFNRLRELIS